MKHLYFSFSHWAFINKRLKERQRPNPKSSSKDDNAFNNLRTGEKLHEILKKSLESSNKTDHVVDIDTDIEEYFSDEDGNCSDRQV